MNERKSKQKLLKQGDSGRQMCIRNFFSTNSRKSIVNDSTSLKELENITNVKRSIRSQDEVTKCSRNAENSGSIITENIQCAKATRSIASNTNTICDTSDKRKYKADEVLSDLLDELENSSPEDYVYVQSLTSSDKMKNNPVKKRAKLSPSLLNHENTDILDSSCSRNGEQFCVKVNIKKHPKSDEKTTGNSKAMGLSLQSSESTVKVQSDLIDLENLADFLNNECDEWLISTSDLNLNEWTYCKVISMHYLNNSLKLTLQKFIKASHDAVISPPTTTCVLSGCWIDTPLKVNDIVSIKAHFNSKSAHWVVDNEQGFITVHPDILITGTGIVGSLFCQRRSVLGYIFPNCDPPNIAMLIGSLVHELLQEVLRKQIYSTDGIQEIINNLIGCKRTLYLAYECEVALSTVRSQLEEFSPKISSFMNTYMMSTNSSSSTKMWPGEILQILSIEENFWIPQLGIKGKTDVILKARKNDEIKILPLELKTGRASNSSEHRGQIILYVIMMAETGIDVDTGLLFYLRENSITEINPKHAERIGLLNMRNGLVSHIVANETPTLLSPSEFKLPTLPEPIHHHNACAKCPYLTVCSASLTKQHQENMSKKNPLNELSVKALTHLTESHIRYVFFWLGLLKLEECERKRNRSFDISDLWHVDVAEREKRGYCISNLRLQSVDVLGSKFLHKMKRVTTASNRERSLINTCALIEGDYLVVSKGSRYALASGYVDTIEEQEITLKLDRWLEKDDNEFYVIDKYSMFDGLLGFNTSSLLLLLEDTVPANNLRSFIIDMISPTFTSKLPSTFQEHIFGNLNKMQKNAILKTLQADHYTLIKGMPGTGKTATIVGLVKLLVSMKHSVLITSHTHSAVDNILLRLKENELDFLRLGSYAKVHDSLKTYCEDYVLEKCNFKNVSDLENFYGEKQVIAVTCMGCTHVIFRKRQFDYCIVDEASQVLLPSVIKSLYCCKKFVLIGDPDQLPPVVQSKKASHLGLSESLFEKLDKPQVTSILDLQYRMNSQIMQLANSFAYANSLKCANERVASATMYTADLDEINSRYTDDWMRLALSSDLSHSVVLINTANLKNKTSSLSEYSNQNEADIAFSIVRNLNQIYNASHDIGIIAPYREQVKLLRNMASADKYLIEINTVDQYQGRDKDVIIYCCTKTSSTGDSGILSDKRRLTVAITRAKRKLIIIANVSALRTYTVFEQLFNFIPETNTVDVTSLEAAN